MNKSYNNTAWGVQCREIGKPADAERPLDPLVGLADLQEALKLLAEYRVGWLPECCRQYADKEDHMQPLLSEAYLYNLQGKEEARSIRALLRPIFEYAKVDFI
jgi:hypothetical protein